MSLEQEALKFIYCLQKLCFENSDVNALLPSLGENISWIGTRERGMCHNLAQAKELLLHAQEECTGNFSNFMSDCEALAITEDACVVYGQITAAPGGPQAADAHKRFTAVCKKTPEGMRLLHLHLSVADRQTVQGRCYTQRETVEERRELYARTCESERRLAVREEELRALTENIPGGIHQCKNNADFTLIDVTDSFLSLMGYSRKELRDRFHDRFVELILPKDRETVAKAIREQLSRGDTIELEYRVRRGNGDIIWILDKGKLAVQPDNTQTFYCMLLDITEQRKAREDLRLSLERHKIIMDQATDIIFEWSISGDTLMFSPNWRKKFGYDPIKEDISRKIPFSENIYPEDIPVFINLMENTAAGVPYTEAEFRIRDVMGNFTWCRIRATVQYDDAGRPVKAVGVIVDIDADKKQHLRLLEEAQRDSLTGLFNKAAVRRAVEEELSGERNAFGVLLIIDLDDFKGINDRYGHLTGDAVLSDTAATLKRLFRSSDIVARIGGDEFLVCLPGASVQIAQRKTKEAFLALAEIPIFGQKNQVSCSVGAAVFPQDGQDFLALYRCADLALYQVKKAGKGGFCLYAPELGVQGPAERMVRSAVGAVIDSDARVVNERLGQYCFQMLYRAIQPMVAVHQILEIVGRAYDVSRAYIFESSEDGLCCSNTFEWCNTGVPPEISRLQNLSYREDLGDYIKNFDQNGVFYCGDIRELHPLLYSVLEPQGIRSLLQCAIVDDGQFKGYVGFDECRENRHWTQEQVETLTLVANVLSTFLIKLRLKERLNQFEKEGGSR